MDRRQRRTRYAIFEALSGLLEEKSYSHISVQDIANRANIGRSTFYEHFETKDDLLREISTELFNHVFSVNTIMEKTHDLSNETDNPYAVITHILYHLRENQKNLFNILTYESRSLFLKFFKQYVDELYTVQALSGIGDKNMTVPYKFLIYHIYGSFINMIQWWIKGGMKQSPEEMTVYFKAVIDPIIRKEEDSGGK
ncbi:MAG: TetR family transcriptional regulator [Firmicutes bacterium]|nr:TetR family transcriptional regulator [Bacillota bacterium]